MKSIAMPTAVRQHGRTLLELLIALAIGLVIMLALGTVYLGTSSTTRQSTSVNRMSEDAAIVFKFIGDNLRMAGFSRPRALTLPGGPIIDGVKVTAPDRAFTGAAVRGCDHGFADSSVAFENLTCAADANQPAAIAIRFEGDELNTVPINGNPSDCLNQEVVDTLTSVLGPYHLIESRFATRSDGASGTPELTCGGNGSDTFSPQPLVQFVEDIQLRYGITSASQTSRDVARYVTAAEINALGGSVDHDWSRVVNVRICLVMRGQNRDQSDSSSYIGCDGNTAASDDGLARRAFTSVYALRNASDFLQP